MGATAYVKLGWPDPIPVRLNGKEPAVKGLTGIEAPDLTAEDVRGLVAKFGNRSIGLRLHDGVIGLDIDDYDGRVGAETITAAEAALGPLPATWTTTSRGRGQPSGIRLYRVPTGRRWRDAQANLEDAHGANVDVIHRGHRHAMVQPSVHPDTRQSYLWFGPDGKVSTAPTPADLKELPAAWIGFLTQARRSSTPTARREFQESPQEARERPQDGAIPASTRHNTLARYAGTWRAHGLGLADAEVLLRHYWQRCEQPDGDLFPWEEAAAVLVDVYDRYPAGPWRQEPPPPDAPIDESGPQNSPPNGEVRAFATIDLAKLAREGVDPAELLCDGMLYRSGLHSLGGEPDAGKGTVFGSWAVKLLAAGHTVVLLDEEGGADVVTEKLVALGATPEHLEGLAYVEFPGRSWDAADQRGLWKLLAEVRPALIGYDSSGAFMAAAGKDENVGGDVTPFYQLLLKASREFEAATVIIDHLTKTATGRYTRGSGAKLQIVDVGYLLTAVKRFDRKTSGLLKLKAVKDRRGYLHRDHEVRVAVEPGTMALTFTAVGERKDDGGPLAGLQPAVVKVYGALPDETHPETIAQITDRVVEQHHHGLKRATVQLALQALADRGLADGAGEVGQEKRWWRLSATVDPPEHEHGEQGSLQVDGSRCPCLERRHAPGLQAHNEWEQATKGRNT
jgi:hypothetical protein